MNEIEQKLEVLSKIAEQLNKENITWAIGASLLLYIKGKANYFNDIDIMVVEEDAQKLKSILSQMGDIQPSNTYGQYKTRCFLEYVIDSVDVDVMAGFVIVNNGKDYDCSLRKEDIKEFVTINGQKIPLQSLEEWKRYYELMGRTEKVKMIDNKTSNYSNIE